MESVLLSIAGGLITQIVTWLSLKTKISQTTLSILLPVVFGGIYYVARQYFIDETTRQQIVWFISWSYASGQLFYNFRKQQGRLDKK